MTTVSIEVEVASTYPVETVFKVFNKFHDIAPKVSPQAFKSIEILEGDGGVGTIRLFTFGDDIPFTSGKFKQDVIDASNFTYNYTFFEGDNLMGILDSINHHVKIVPSAEGGCVFKQTVIYNCKGDEKPPVDVLNFEKELYEKTYKAMEAYAAAHPEVYN
ncbi:putative Bet v I/Major latex protein [Helianthus annuus]|uniref:Bet v I/Major latex protein n=2 Tax=Helianthus annuus TaxID=4232 RepID=A0A9K3JKB8_HELAN|nr:root allergen protein-like [Helianthus annuus]KAF5816407.1 putative Bet v I/Major latex protein [Helianthus annuus]